MSHDGQLWAVRTRVGAGGQDRHRLLVAAPLFHMNALGIAKLVLAAGASMVLLPQFNARRYVEAIGRFKVTWLTSVPTMLALAVRERETLARTDLSSVEIDARGLGADHAIAHRRGATSVSEGDARLSATARRRRAP